MGLRRREIADLYARRYVGFRNALAMVTGSYDTARDVVQEAFAEALRQRRSFRGEGTPEAWIWSIAVRIARRERGRQGEQTTSRDGELPETEVGFVEVIRDPAVAAALRDLPERRRLITFLHYFADLSYEQIAEICEVAPGTVAATLTQARNGLRATLEANNNEVRT
jgi:RNA polymerase sigma-70 factor (ECF subfamily)